MNLINNCGEITTMPDGVNYVLEPGKLYNLNYNYRSGYPYLEDGGVLSIPKKVYSTEEDNMLSNMVLNHFKKDNKKTTGVLLDGLKGSGKTMMSKMIANKAGVPIIAVSGNYRTNRLHEFFDKVDVPVCIMFDEIDKNKEYWETEDLLTFLDGLQQQEKRLVMMTCNDTNNMSQYILNRCSRVLYYKYYEEIGYGIIWQIANDLLFDTKTDDEINEISNFIHDKFSVVSYDNVISFLQECATYPKYNYKGIVKFLNITLKDDDDDEDEKDNDTVKIKDTNEESDNVIPEDLGF